MKRPLPLALLLLSFIVAACQDENPLSHGFSYTGVWETAGLEGVVCLFELEEVGDSLAGNFFLEYATGGLSDPAPLPGGGVAGEKSDFPVDFAGAMIDSSRIARIG